MNSNEYFDLKMIQFNEETACVFGGPYPGNYAAYHITDYSCIRSVSNLELTISEANSKWMKEKPEQLNLIDGKVFIDFPTVERPVALCFSGNDDTSYSKFFSTLADAEAELESLLKKQPLDFFKDLDLFPNGGWVFTN